MVSRNWLAGAVAGAVASGVTFALALASGCGCGPEAGLDGAAADSGGGSVDSGPLDCSALVAAPIAPETLASGLQAPEGLAFDGDGNLLVSRTAGAGGIDRLTTTGAAATWALGTGPVLGLAPAGGGGIYAARASVGAVALVSADGSFVDVATGLSVPNGIARSPDGALYISDFAADEVFRFEAGASTSFVATIGAPNGLAFSPDGASLYVTAFNQGVLYEANVTSPGLPPMVAGALGGADGVAVDRCGNVYVADYLGGRVLRVRAGTFSAEIVASGIDGAASFAFGEGPGWEPSDLYVTSTGGNAVVRLAVGVPGVPLVP